jgi:hypothetical protein
MHGATIKMISVMLVVFYSRNEIEKPNFTLGVKQMTATGNLSPQALCCIILAVHVVSMFFHCCRRAEIETVSEK